MSLAIITGASSGLGKEFAIQLKKQNLANEFWLISRRTDKLKALAKTLDCKCKILSLDLSVLNDLEAYKRELMLNTPKVKYLINAAGYGKYGDYTVINTDIAFNMIDLNIKALVYVTQETIPFMSENSHILQLGSASTYHPLPNFNIYASTKSFVKHYSRALHRELRNKQISVTTVNPGWVKTEFFARAEINDTAPDSFARPMVNATQVVNKAIKDTIKNKDISMYHWYNNIHHFLSKILPHSILIKIWETMQRKN